MRFRPSVGGPRLERGDGATGEAGDALFTISAWRLPAPYRSFNPSAYGRRPQREVRRVSAMSRVFLCAFVPLMLATFVPAPAAAAPNCLRDQKPFKLAGDSIEWS